MLRRAYSNVMIMMHWLVTIVAILHLVNAMTLAWLQDLQISLAVMGLHRSFGIVLFVLMAIRLVIRFGSPVPSISAMAFQHGRLLPHGLCAFFALRYFVCRASDRLGLYE